MKILFCKIASMKYYKSICADDLPINGGEYVKQTGYGPEREIHAIVRLRSGDGVVSDRGSGTAVS